MNLNDKTPLAIQPDSGIQLNLSNYYRIRTWQGGGEFWEHNNQQLIRDALGQFLPRATVDGGNHVLFQHFESGKEICSQSQPVSATNTLPKEQIDQLRSALIAFKAKTQDPHCDPEARKLIDCFRLPDPQKDPELYRIYGSGKNKRLIVLWGAEKEVDSAVTPLLAINMVDTEPASAVKGNGKTMLVAVLLILLALLGVFLWQRDKEKNLSSGTGNSGNGTPLQVDREVNKGGSGESFVVGGNKEDQSNATSGGATNENAAQPGIVGGIPKDDDAQPEMAGGPAADNKPSDAAGGNAVAPGANPKSEDPTKNPLLNEPKSSDRPSASTAAAEGTDPKISKPSGSDNKDVASENNEEGEPASAEPSALTNAENSKLDSENSTNSAQPAPLMKDNDSEAISGVKDDGLSNKKNDPAGPEDGLPPEPGNNVPNDSDTPKPGTTTTAEMSETKIQIKETTPLDPSGKPSALPGESDAINTGNLQIQADVGDVPQNGKVEVILGLVARDKNLKEIEMDRATWLLDGITLQGQDGKPINDPKVSRWLPIGKHALSVVGKTKEGKEVRGEAVLDVRIKQQPKPEVDIQNSIPSENK